MPRCPYTKISHQLVTDGFGLVIESSAVILFEGNPPRFRNSENMKAGNESGLAVGDGYGRSSLHNPGERGEDLTDFTRVFEPVIIALTVTVVAHHIGQAEGAQYIAHTRHASADRAGDLAGV